MNPNPYMRKADSYLHRGDHDVTERVLDHLRRLEDIVSQRDPTKMAGCIRVGQTCGPEQVSLEFAHEDGSFTACRFDRGNGDPIRFLHDRRDPDWSMTTFVRCAILHVEAALGRDADADALAAIAAAVGRTMRLHRRKKIEDWRKEVHAETATPWSPPRTFLIKVDEHGNCVPDRNLLPASLRRSASTSVTVEGSRLGRSFEVRISPSQRTFDPDALSVIEEMRTYDALNREIEGADRNVRKAA